MIANIFFHTQKPKPHFSSDICFWTSASGKIFFFLPNELHHKKSVIGHNSDFSHGFIFNIFFLFFENMGCDKNRLVDEADRRFSGYLFFLVSMPR